MSSAADVSISIQSPSFSRAAIQASRASTEVSSSGFTTTITGSATCSDRTCSSIRSISRRAWSYTARNPGALARSAKYCSAPVRDLVAMVARVTPGPFSSAARNRLRIKACQLDARASVPAFAFTRQPVHDRADLVKLVGDVTRCCDRTSIGAKVSMTERMCAISGCFCVGSM